MSDPDFYREKVKEQFQGILKRLAGDLEGSGLAAEIVAELIAEMKERFDGTLREQFEAGLWSQVERQKLVAFVEQLLTRQGGGLPDFDQLYEQKAELDRKLLDDERP